MNERCRPQGAALEALGGVEDTIPVIVDGRVLTRREWSSFLDGYTYGYSAGIDRGRGLADDEAAELHRRAGVIVDRMAKLDTYDVRRLKAKVRALESANAWLSRRGVDRDDDVLARGHGHRDDELLGGEAS